MKQALRLMENRAKAADEDKGRFAEELLNASGGITMGNPKNLMEDKERFGLTNSETPK